MTKAVAKAMLQTVAGGNSITIMSEGMGAAQHDDESGELTDNPYSNQFPLARADWYIGYNYWMEHKDEPA